MLPVTQGGVRDEAGHAGGPPQQRGMAGLLHAADLRSPPLASRLPGPQRAAIAAAAMWSTWIAAYALGFSSHPVVHAYAGGSGVGIVADQEIAVGLVWGVAGACFVPVILTAVLSWLKDGGGIDEEFRRAFPEASPRAGVRGWDRPPRRGGGSSG